MFVFEIIDQNVFVIEAKSVQTMTGVSVSVGAAESRDETVVNGDYTNCCKMLRLSVGLSTFIYWSTCPSIDIYLTVNDMKDLYCTSTKRRYGFKQE